MIPVVLLSGVEPVAAGRFVGSDRANALRLLPQLEAGDILSARVEAKLPDGSYKVMLAGQPLSMALPSYTAPGDTLVLAFVTREPRLTFALRDMQQAALAPAPVLSAAGRLIAATMLQPGELALITTSSAAALLAAVPADGVRLSGALAQSLAESGLFYESHQAEWIAGKRDLAQIRQEPQARLTQPAPAPEAGATVSPTATAAELPRLTPAPREDQGIHPQTVPLVQQQLVALDTAKVAMQLEVWPAQWMHWEIEERQPDARREPDAPQTWITRLRLDLPRLGELEATLSLGSDGVRVALEAASATSTALLREQCASLHDALTTAGVAHAGIVIEQHEQS
jgi:flagellar hook-length control protein FliK